MEISSILTKTFDKRTYFLPLFIFLSLLAGFFFFNQEIPSTLAAFPGWENINTIYYNPAQDDPTNKFLEQAANELKTNLEQVGKILTISTTTAPAIGIFLKVEPTLPELTTRNDEAFKLFTDASGVYITGKTPIAVRHGAYTLLEKLGFRWFFKNPMWKVKPNSLISLDGLNEVQEPAFVYRRIWTSYQDMPDPQSYRDWKEWNRLGGAATYDVYHNYNNIIPTSEAAAHPTWFCYNAAGSPRQLNVTNPEVIAKAKQFAISQLSVSKPGSIDDLNDYLFPASIPVSPNDGPGWDSCFDPNNLQLITDKVFDFANQAARAVREALGQKKYVGVYSYAAYSCTPSIPLEPNLLVQIATAFGYCSQSVTQRIEGVAAKGAMIGIRDYYDVWAWGHDQPTSLPGHFNQILFFANNNVKVINAESGDGWGARGPLYYVISKLYWDPNAEPRAILDDFYDKAFGSAKGPIKKYHDLWYYDSIVSNNKMGLAYKYLDEAEKLAGGNSAVLDRIRFLEYYMRYVWKWKQKDTMSLNELKSFYTDMCKISPWSVAWFKYIRYDERSPGIGYILMHTYGLTRSDLDALCDQTLPTNQQAQTWLQEGLIAFPNPIEAPDIDWKTLSLVPLGNKDYPKLPTILAKGGRTILVPAKAGDTVTVKQLWYCRVGNITWADSKGTILDTKTPNPCVAEVNFTAPRDDIYQLACLDQCNMDVTSHGASYLVAPGINKVFLEGGSMYLYVPVGTPGLIVGIAPWSPYNAIVKLYDPAGNLAMDKLCSGRACEWGLNNPTSGVWRLDYNGTYDGEGTFLWLRGVPPLLWFDPEHLLVPASALLGPLPFSITTLNRLYFFQEKDYLFQILGSNFSTSTSFSLNFVSGTTTISSLTLQPKDTTTFELNLTSNQITGLPLGFYDLVLERISDGYKLTYSKKILITKIGDLWSQTAAETAEQKRDGKVDIYDASRMLSKWGSTSAADLAEADINPGPSNISQGKIDLYDANLMMKNWQP